MSVLPSSQAIPSSSASSSALALSSSQAIPSSSASVSSAVLSSSQPISSSSASASSVNVSVPSSSVSATGSAISSPSVPSSSVSASASILSSAPVPSSSVSASDSVIPSGSISSSSPASASDWMISSASTPSSSAFASSSAIPTASVPSSSASASDSVISSQSIPSSSASASDSVISSEATLLSSASASSAVISSAAPTPSSCPIKRNHLYGAYSSLSKRDEEEDKQTGTDDVCAEQRGKTQNFKQIDLRQGFKRTLCTEQSKGGKFLYYKYIDGQETVKESKGPEPKNQPKAPLSADAKCDHLVELNIVKKVMEGGGICDELATLYAAGGASVSTADNAVKNIMDQGLNTFGNLVYANNLLEDEKTEVVKYVFAKTQDIGTLKLKKPIQADEATTTPRVKAVNDYLTQSKEKSVASAANLDTIIKNAFPNLTPTLKVADLWNTVLTTASELAQTYPGCSGPPPDTHSPSGAGTGSGSEPQSS